MNLSLLKGSKKKKKMEISIFGLNPTPPLPKMEKWNKKNFISRSVGVFTPNWYQRWKIKKKIPDPPPLMEFSIFFFWTLPLGWLGYTAEN